MYRITTSGIPVRIEPGTCSIRERWRDVNDLSLKPLTRNHPTISSERNAPSGCHGHPPPSAKHRPAPFPGQPQHVPAAMMGTPFFLIQRAPAFSSGLLRCRRTSDMPRPTRVPELNSGHVPAAAPERDPVQWIELQPATTHRIHDTRQDGTEHDHRIPGRFTLFMANSPGCLS